jgi:two-component system, NarL family, nitrate/nitrite response regulator NarL
MQPTTVPDTTHRVKVLIAVDVRLYREGLAASLDGRGGIAVVGLSAGRAETRARVAELTPDVAVLDVSTRENCELIRDLRADAPQVKILAFGVDELSSDVLECAEAGAAGYVTADASVEDLVIAIERITREELVCSPRIAAQLFGRMAQRAAGWTPHPDDHPLTLRERQVLDLIRQGFSNKEIGQQLNIAEPTVKNHVHHLLEKLDVSSRAQAVARMTIRDRGRGFSGARPEPARGTG